MRGTIVRTGAIGAAALLTIGFLMTQPAGAAGSDKHDKSSNGGTAAACFDSSGKTQGRSHSDPDGLSNGGADKPGCTGGFDSDKDGNNGCGNDADREDDNNGRCGGDKDGQEPTTPGSTATTSSSTTTTSSSTTTTTTTVAAAVTGLSVDAAGPIGEPAVLASTVDPAASTSPAPSQPSTEVLGETIERPSALARTGAGIGALAMLGGLLCGGGRLALLARRFLRID